MNLLLISSIVSHKDSIVSVRFQRHPPQKSSYCNMLIVILHCFDLNFRAETVIRGEEGHLEFWILQNVLH